jgi:two-component system response regulator AtoC
MLMYHRIIVVDDEVDFLQSVRRGLLTAGFRHVVTQSDPVEALTTIERQRRFDLALLDITMPGMDGLELLARAKRAVPDLEAIMVTASNDARLAVESLQTGAYDYLIKPVTLEDLVVTINRALEHKRLLQIIALDKEGATPQLRNKEAFAGIMTQDPKMVRILREAELHAASNVPMLITGESGTGKGALALAIHKASGRAAGPFTPINMASLPSELFEAEFYGHTAGAFTGATRERKGYVEQTHGGTLFLDEIGTLPLELQGKLLRVLQEGEFMRLGSSHHKFADLRIVTATNATLDELLQQGRFRKDLYYRLKGAWLHLPPLSRRLEDIPLLAAHFAAQCHFSGERPPITSEAMELLMYYPFPGNIRELRSIIQTSANLSQGAPISPSFLPQEVRQSRPRPLKAEGAGYGNVVPLAQWEKEYILKVYQRSGRNKTVAAQWLGIGVNTLRRKLNSYGGSYK